MLYNKKCDVLSEIADTSLDALITDPPYGISYQNNYWDKDLPDKAIWSACYAKMKPGAFGTVFSSIRLMHRLMVALEDSGFLIKDVLFWVYLNGMPKSRDISLDIDKDLNVDSTVVGNYKYVQGYKDTPSVYKRQTVKNKLEPASEKGLEYKGFGLGVKPAYEPIILIQKPIEEGLTISQNIIKYGTGALNLEETRLPFADRETDIGHNPHPKGRVTSNILRTDELNDGYDKFFVVPKVRGQKDRYNTHPTVKPVALMTHLVKLLTREGQTVLDCFMGSGTTGVSCKMTKRQFIGYDDDTGYYNIAVKRITNTPVNNEIF